MAASDDFQREVFQSSGITSGIAQVTFPACLGISWVLTQVNGAWVVTVAYTGALYFEIAVNGEILDQGGTPEPHAIGDGAKLSFDGKIEFPLNTAVTVGFTSANGVGNEVVTASAYAK